MTTNTGNKNIEQIKTIIDIAKKEAELAKNLSDQETNPDTTQWMLSKKAIEEEKSKEKEKEETIIITTLKDLPMTKGTYKRTDQKNYKISVDDISYEFYGNGETRITKEGKTITEKTKNALTEIKKQFDEKAKNATTEVEKIFDEKKKEEESKKATEQAKADQVRLEQVKSDQAKADQIKLDLAAKLEQAKTKETKEKIEDVSNKVGNAPKTEWNKTEATKIEEEITEIRTAKDGKNTRLEITDRQGNIMLEASYEGLEVSSDKPAVIKFKEQGKWGMLDSKGNQIIEPIYESIYFTKEWNVACKLDKKWWVLNKKWEIIDSFKIE